MNCTEICLSGLTPLSAIGPPGLAFPQETL